MEGYIKSETIVLGSVRLAHRSQWDRRTVRKYLDLLKKSMNVSIHTYCIASIITILNWGKYPCDVHPNTQPHARKIPTYNNIKNKEEELEEKKFYR